MASARARYSLGSFAMTIAASAKTVPATIAIHFQRRRMAPNSSSTVYVRSIATLRESVAGALPRQPELHHVAVHLRHHVPVRQSSVACGGESDRPFLGDAVI